MDILQLKYFISVAQTLNFSEAARRNYISQPSISHHINELERQLGAKLFVRSSHSVQLTSAGREFLPYAMQIVETAQQATLRVRQSGGGERGHLAISGVTTASEAVSRCLSAFSKKYPEVLVDVTFTSGSEQVLTMQEGKYDFHFALEDMVPKGRAWEYLVSHTDDLCLVLPRDHPMAGREADFRRLENDPFIMVTETESPTLYGQIMEVCAALRYAPRVINRYDRAESVLLSVGAGLGISIVPRAITKVFYSDNVSIVPLTGVETRRVYVVAWRRQMSNTTAFRFLDIVRSLYPAAGQEVPG